MSQRVQDQLEKGVNLGHFTVATITLILAIGGMLVGVTMRIDHIDNKVSVLEQRVGVEEKKSDAYDSIIQRFDEKTTKILERLATIESLIQKGR
jgi:cell division protein FtsL